MKLASVNVNQMQVFVIIDKVGIMKNADMNVKNQLTKKYKIKDLFGILVTVIANVINPVMLENIQTMKIVNVEKNQSINWLKNEVKTMMEMKDL